MTILKQQAQEMYRDPHKGVSAASQGQGDRKCKALGKETQDAINRVSNPEDCNVRWRALAAFLLCGRITLNEKQ